MLRGKHILVGVTGGIAAYKSAYLVRELIRAEAEVRVVMTHAATQFITPLTMSTLSKNEVLVDMFPPNTDQSTGQSTSHITLSLWADLMLIAPASANTIAKIAGGNADNLLTTLVLALRCPLVCAPAMDVDMYRNEMTQRNIAALRESGCVIIEPEVGELASGLMGPGRLPEVDRIVAEVTRTMECANKDLAGKKVLVTAGPTYEPIDPVRFIGNRSSGKMGYAVANAASQRGAEVTLISGPVALRTPRNVVRIDVETAQEMQTAVRKVFANVDILVMAAAVADFSPAKVAEQKIKRDELLGKSYSLELAKNPDILQGIESIRKNQVVIGFALETNNGLFHAREKLRSKHLDFIVLNNPLEEGAGFGSDTNIVTIVGLTHEPEPLPRMSKISVAHALLDRAIPLLKR